MANGQRISYSQAYRYCMERLKILLGKKKISPMKKWPEKARFYIQTFIHTTNEDKALKNLIGREKSIF